VSVAALAAGALVGGVWVGWPLAVSARRWRRFAEHAESERAWAAFARRRDGAGVSAADEAWRAGTEFCCSCGRREVTYRGDPPPTCGGVSCIGSEHELRLMRDVSGP
jgi:hypothetical protein